MPLMRAAEASQGLILGCMQQQSMFQVSQQSDEAMVAHKHKVWAVLLGVGLLIELSNAETSWIMANTRLPVPTCPAHCLTVNDSVSPGVFSGQNVGFSSCKSSVDDSSSNQQWIYEHLSRTITIVEPITAALLCLEPVFRSYWAPHLSVSRCAGKQNQQWTVDVENATIASNLSPEFYICMTSTFLFAAAGISWHDATLVLANSTEQGHNRIVSLVPYGEPLSGNASMVDARANLAGNLVVNGGFELSSHDLSATNETFVVSLSTGDIFGSCGWKVSSGQVQICARQTLQGELSMHLDGLDSAGSISQLLEASTGSYYVLSFLLAGNTGCQEEQVIKSLRVLITPSSVPEVVSSFEAANSTAKRMGWITKTYAFRAQSDVINLTFQSLTGGGCGPYIDDVRVVKYDGAPLAALSNPSEVSIHRRRPMLGLSSAAMAGAIAGAAVAAFLAGGLCIAVIFFGFIHMPKSVGATSSQTLATSEGVALAPAIAMSQEISGRRFPAFGGVRILSFAQLDKATQGFSTLLGKGSLGYVYLAEFEGGRRGAVQRMFRMVQLTEMEFFDMVKMLGRAIHPNIVKLIAFSRDRGEQILVFEYVPNGSLYERLHGPNVEAPLPWNTRIKVALDIATALEYLHHVANPPVVHQSVKSSNVMLSKELNAKLAHCGAWRHDRGSLKASLGGYLDPHYFRTGILTEKSDVYSFGVLLLELISGRKVEEDNHLLNWAQEYLSGQARAIGLVDPRLLRSGSWNQIRSLDNIVEVIKLCIQDEPEDRPNASEVVEVLRQCALNTQTETTPETRSRPNSPVTPF